MYRIRIGVHTRAKQIPWEELLRPGRPILYSWLHKADPAVAEQIHGSETRSLWGYGPPTFPHAQRQPGIYAAGGDGYWEIGTTQAEIAALWMKSLQDKPLLNWGGVALTVTGLEAATPPPALDTGNIVWRTATPVCLRSSRKDGSRTVLPDDPKYLGLLRATLRSRAKTHGITVKGDPNAWIQWAGGKRTILVSGTDKPRVGAHLQVRIAAPAELLKVLWCTGIGSQTGAGLGWIQDTEGDGR